MKDIRIGGVRILPGERKKISLELARLYDFTEMSIPVEVVRGRKPGPILFVSGALHGDEINGVEIIKRLLNHKAIQNISGTLVAVPIVNVFGFVHKSRYLPDRRDLNRSFPGSDKGSLAALLAYKFMKEIVEKCDYGIDLHTGAIHRTNFPQIRVNLQDKQSARLAHAFGAKVVIHSSPIEGSMRQSALAKEIPVIVYEGGEALRFDEPMIKQGLFGILSVMQHLGMVPGKKEKAKKEAFVAHSTTWVRAPHSGILRAFHELGCFVKKDELLGVISNPFGEHTIDVVATRTGMVIGTTVLPLVNEGDALFHIASFEEAKIQEPMDPADAVVPPDGF